MVQAAYTPQPDRPDPPPLATYPLSQHEEVERIVPTEAPGARPPYLPRLGDWYAERLHEDMLAFKRTLRAPVNEAELADLVIRSHELRALQDIAQELHRNAKCMESIISLVEGLQAHQYQYHP